MPTPVAVVGIDRSTWDFVVTLPRGHARDALEELGLPTGGVHHVRSRERVVEAIDVLTPLGRLVRAPGGPVSNTLAAMATLAGALRPAPDAPRPGLKLHWVGEAGRVGEHPREPAGSPLDSLRRLSIATWTAQIWPKHFVTLCLVDEASRETFLILVQDTPAPTEPPRAPVRGDIAIAALRDLVAHPVAVRALGQRLALIAGDGVQLDSAGRAALGTLAADGAIGWVFGTFDELRALGLLCLDSGRSLLAGTELVATRGTRPVLAALPGAARPEVLQVPALPRVRGSDLGAGDAYAGGYLLGRLIGEPVGGAHELGLRASGQVLEVDGARPAPALGIEGTSGSATGRFGLRDDVGGLFVRVRATHGLTVVCGGQTGVDQLGLGAAADLGLPAFCVLPDGRRTEVTEGLAAGPDDFHTARVEVLSSPSYRNRTWVTAYLGDGTLLWDFRNSEGSLAAKDACAAFGRPLLDLTKIEPGNRIEAARRWSRRHDVRVINIAGNRGSFLSPDERALVERECFAVLRALAYDRADGVMRAQTAAARSAAVSLAARRSPSQPLRIGVSSASAQRRLFARFLAEAYGAEIPAAPALTASLERPALDIVFARAEDIPAFLRDGAIDVGLCGSDVVHGLVDEATVILDTGLFPLLIVLVGRPGTALSGDPPPGGWRLGCQYGKRFADTLTALSVPKNIKVIGGTAEVWLHLGLLDLAVDTWKTGATAEGNGATLLEVLLGTSLVALAPATAAGPDDPALSKFADTLADWLAGSHTKDRD